MQNKKRLPKFYLILIICWVVALAALAICLLTIRSYLADYESVQPKYVAEDVFQQYFKKSDFAAIIAHSGLNDSKFESDETLSAHLASLTEGKELSYHNISSGMDQSESKYIVKYSDGDTEIKIGSFILKKTSEKSKKGFAKYALDSFELFYPTNESVTIRVTQGAIPYINGVALDESYITEDNIEHASCAHMPEGVSGIKFTVYYLEGLTTAPEISIKDASGNELDFSYNSAEGRYETPIAYDEALAVEQSEHAIAAAQTLATYMQNDCTLGKLTPYFEKGTELYNSIRSTLQWAVIDHDSFHFEDVEASEFYRYDENTFSCRIKLTHVLKRSRLEDYRDTVDAIFYFRNVDGKYLVYDRTNN